MEKRAFPRALSAGVLVVAVAAALLNGPAFAEIKGKCSKAVGSFLTENTLDNDGRTGTSRSLLVLTNGGHSLRFDSDETGAAMDSRPFGNSAGTWRCDGVDKDGTVRLTATMLDFTYPDAEGDKGQIARIDMTGTYAPKTEVMELKGTLGFFPMNAAAQKADTLANVWEPITITLRGARIELPAAPSSKP
jgi:hypothetical protein